jgi:hypothetical protein
LGRAAAEETQGCSRDRGCRSAEKAAAWMVDVIVIGHGVLAISWRWASSGQRVARSFLHASRISRFRARSTALLHAETTSCPRRRVVIDWTT